MSHQALTLERLLLLSHYVKHNISTLPERTNPTMSAHSTHQTSSLLLLPPEIRNQTYTYVFASSMYIIVRQDTEELFWRFVRQHKTSSHHDIALLRVYRQTYYKTYVLPFKLSTFLEIPSLFGPHKQTGITYLYWKIRDSDRLSVDILLSIVMQISELDLWDMLPGVKHVVWDTCKDRVVAGPIPFVLVAPILTSSKLCREKLEKWVKKGDGVE